MAVEITVVPTTPRAVVDTARIDMTGNDDVTPVYFSIEHNGVPGDTAKSQPFTGNGLLFTHVFPSDSGDSAWKVYLRKVADDSDLSEGGTTVDVLSRDGEDVSGVPS